MFSIWQRFRRLTDTAIEWWPDILGALMLVIGLLVFLSEHFGWSVLYIPVLSDLFIIIWPELIGIGLAVIIIDNANEILRRREEKKRLILQMGSPEHAFAIEAVRQLRTRGWLTDGSLREADLMEADLREANLMEADLREAMLMFADLADAILWEADLENANLEDANLMGAGLREAILMGADLEDANLENADLENANLENANLENANLENANLENAKVTLEQLSKVKSLEGATMPDGTVHQAEDSEEKQEGLEPLE